MNYIREFRHPDNLDILYFLSQDYDSWFSENTACDDHGDLKGRIRITIEHLPDDEKETPRD